MHLLTLGMGRVRFSALGLGFGLRDLIRVGSQVNEFWFGFIKLCSGSGSGLVYSSFFQSILTKFGQIYGKIFFGLVKKFLRVTRAHKKIARVRLPKMTSGWVKYRVGFWPNPSLLWLFENILPKNQTKRNIFFFIENTKVIISEIIVIWL